MSRTETALKFFNMYKDYTDTRVESGVELYRKGNVEITLKNADGTPVSDAVITAKQKSHEFKHGVNLFLLDEFENGDKNALYRETIPEAFNLATLPFYWDTLEPEDGKPRFAADSPKIYRRPAIDLCINYCQEKGIEPKAHCLNYDHFVPAWYRELSVEDAKRRLERRFRELAERYADKIPSWEVTNETFSVQHRTPSKFFSEDDFVEWSFLTADRYFHGNHLIINDYDFWDYLYNNRSAYYMQIERLLRNGVQHLDSVGLQFHSFFPLELEEEKADRKYNPMLLYKILDNYAKLGKRLQLTEMTIPAYSEGAEDEAVQAELLRNIYRILFSHPAMEAIIYWNLVDGYAFSKTKPGRQAIGDMSSGENKYYGGLLRFDMSKKPAFDVIKDLFNNEWITNTSADVKDGKATFRGFYGDYDLDIRVGTTSVKRTLSTSRDNNNTFEIIL